MSGIHCWCLTPGLCFTPLGNSRNFPLILFVVEDLRIIHMVGCVDCSLQRKDILRIAKMGSQALGHFRKWKESFWENFGIGFYNWIIRIGKIKLNLSAVG